jgi:MFS family permease
MTLAAASLLIVGYLGVYTAPLQISALVQSGAADLTRAGTLVTIHILGTALGALLSPRLRERFQPGWAATVGVFLAAAGFVALSRDFDFDFVLALFCRLAAGLGSGIALGTANAMVAGMAVPEKGYGRANAIMLVSFAVLFAALPRLLIAEEPARLNAILAIICLALIPASAAVPPARIREDRSGTHHHSGPLFVVILFAGAALYFLVCGGVYALSGQAAERAEIPAGVYGLFLSLFALVGIASSLFVGLTGLRWGRFLPLTVGCIGTSLSLLGIVSEVGWETIALGLLGYGIFSIFTINYVMGTAAAIDPDGKISAILGGFVLIPYAVGPSAFSYIAENLGWNSLPFIIALGCVGSGGLLIFLARQIDGASGEVGE